MIVLQGDGTNQSSWNRESKMLWTCCQCAYFTCLLWESCM